MNEVTTSSAYQLTTTPAPVGWKSGAISGTYQGQTLGENKSLISGLTGPNLLISEVVQGSALFDSVPDYVGMPTQNTPLCDVVFFPDLLATGVNAFYRILSVVDDQTMIVEDIKKTAGDISGIGAYVLSSRYNPLTGIDVDGIVFQTFGAMFLDGTILDGCPCPMEYNGTPLEPILLYSNDGVVITVTR